MNTFFHRISLPSSQSNLRSMPSRPIDPPSPPPLTAAPTLDYHHHHHHHRPKHLLLVLTTTLTLTLLVSFLLLAILLYRKLCRSRTAPAETPNRNNNNNTLPRRFSYSLLRRSTAYFSSSTRLGHGGFGSVYKATLPSGVSLAVKLMDSPGSLQGEREFHNELSICASLNHANILTLLGHSSDKRRHRLLLVYELMPNRSLQDAFFAKKSPELMDWRKRFDIVKHVASGLHYLHYFCDPPVIHGDIKPSNILLDAEFSAKIGDFGLARLKTEGEVLEEEECNGEEGVKLKEAVKTNGSVLDDTESVLTTGFDENGVVDLSLESCVVRSLDLEASPEMVVGPAGAVRTDKTSVFSEGPLDKASVDSWKDLIGRKNGVSGRDWWWKQENDEISGSESGRVKKDYVMEWIGNEIGKERLKSDWVASPSTSAKPEEKKRKKRLDWWASLDKEKMRKEKNKKPKEWWKEEFCEELSKKKKKKTDLNSTSGREIWWQKDEDESKSNRKRKSKSSSRGSIDWGLDGVSGDLRNGIKRNNQDWTNTGGIPKSGGISSTPSMRGTLCYIAPECGGGGGNPSEKCDVYSFGVLLLVLVSGRRPLQVMASPMSEFERANLVSWAKQLARRGKLLDLVDPCLHSLDRDQALLCITVALLCLQRSPSKRPTMSEIVAVFSSEAKPPHLPFEFSPSPPSSFFPFKSRRKTAAVLQ